MISVLMEQVGDFLYIDGVIERGGISNLALVGSHFSLETLDQVTDGHTTGDSVGVNDDVWGDPLTGKGHVLQSKFKVML